MQTLGRLAALTLATAAVIAVPTASDAANSWTTLERMDGAKHQACKVVVDDGASWKIKNRLVNGNQARVGAGMKVMRNDEATNRVWSSGLIRRGETSAVGSVKMPRGDDRYSLIASIYGAHSGSGSTVTIGEIGRC